MAPRYSEWVTHRRPNVVSLTQARRRDLEARPLPARAVQPVSSPRHATLRTAGAFHLHFNRIAHGRAPVRPTLLHRNHLRGEPRAIRPSTSRTHLWITTVPYLPTPNSEEPFSCAGQWKCGFDCSIRLQASQPETIRFDGAIKPFSNKLSRFSRESGVVNAKSFNYQFFDRHMLVRRRGRRHRSLDSQHECLLMQSALSFPQLWGGRSAQDQSPLNQSRVI